MLDATNTLPSADSPATPLCPRCHDPHAHVQQTLTVQRAHYYRCHGCGHCWGVSRYLEPAVRPRDIRPPINLAQP